MTWSSGDAGRLGSREALAQAEADVLEQVAVLGAVLVVHDDHTGAGVRGDDTGHVAGHHASPQTSLTITAPASSAAAATDGLAGVDADRHRGGDPPARGSRA